MEELTTVVDDMQSLIIICIVSIQWIRTLGLHASNKIKIIASRVYIQLRGFAVCN